MLNLPYVDVFTDGSCHPNPGRAGAAFVCTTLSISGAQFLEHATNNQAELSAILLALTQLSLREFSRHFDVAVYTDSLYAVNELSRRKYKKNRSNAELIEKILQISARFDRVSFHHIYGHTNHYHNDHADALANYARINENIDQKAVDLFLTSMEYSYDRQVTG